MNISKEGHIKSVKTAQSSNWIFCPRPARSRFSLHGAPKTLQALQKSCEPFPSSFYAAFYSSTSLAGSNKAKTDESLEVKTFSENKKAGANCVGAWDLGGAHTINLLLTLLWKYVWRKQPIVVWNVFKYKIMPFVWGKNLSNVRVQKSPVAFTSTLCAVCALASPLGALPRPL